MVETIVEIKTRNDSGTAAARRLRHTGWVPAIVANQDGSTTPVKFERHPFEMMLRHHQSDNMILDVALDGAEPVKALLQDIQRSTLTGSVLHADFTMISMTETLVVNVSVVLKGEPVGVSLQDGILEQLVHEMEVEGLAGAMVDSLEADVSGLSVGESLLAGAVPIPEGLTLLTAAGIAVATVLAARVEAVVETEVEAAPAAAEAPVSEKK